MKTIISIDEVAGKTVEKVAQFYKGDKYEHSEAFAIHFTDGTALLLGAYDIESHDDLIDLEVLSVEDMVRRTPAEGMAAILLAAREGAHGSTALRRLIELSEPELREKLTLGMKNPHAETEGP